MIMLGRIRRYVRLLSILALFITTSVTATLSTHASEARGPSDHELRAEKHGRVVDQVTGLGIPDAKVIVVWNAHAESAGQGISNMCNLRKIATTDGDGNFTVPEVSESELHVSDRGEKGRSSFLGMRYRSIDFNWRLMVFKPGYARPGDSKALQQPDPRMIQFDWQNESPRISETRAAMQIMPIAMQRSDMPVPQRILYYSAILATGCDTGSGPQALSFIALHAEAFQDMERELCNPPLDYKLNDIELNGIGRLTMYTDQDFYRRLKASHPKYHSTNDGTPHLTADEVCANLHVETTIQ